MPILSICFGLLKKTLCWKREWAQAQPVLSFTPSMLCLLHWHGLFRKLRTLLHSRTCWDQPTRAHTITTCSQRQDSVMAAGRTQLSVGHSQLCRSVCLSLQLCSQLLKHKACSILWGHTVGSFPLKTSNKKKVLLQNETTADIVKVLVGHRTQLSPQANL